MPPIFAAAAAYVATAIGVTSVIGVALINFGIRVLATVVISKLINRKQDAGQSGQAVTQPSRTTVNANTSNKLPIVYGSAYMGGSIIDAKISTDQKYMWYVLAVSEVTDTGSISFNDPNNAGFPLIYWADKKVQFDNTIRYKVTGLIDVNDPAQTVDTKVNGLMEIYFYSDGSNSPLYGAPDAITLLNDTTTGGGIPVDQRWPSTNIMSKTCFMIVRMQYSQDANLTGLQPLTALVTNTLTKPGAVMYDYLTNTRYGAGIESSLVDASSFSDLNTYSDQLITYDDNGTTKSQVRYRINGPLDTNNNCLENLLQVAEACDSWLQWNEQQGQWAIIINRSYAQAGLSIGDLFTVYCDTIRADTNGVTPSAYYAYGTGGVDITPIDLNSTYNRVEVSFPNKDIKDQQDQVYIETPANLMNPNEPINQLSFSLPQVNDDVQAQYIANRRLEQARDDLIVTLTTDYGGIQVDAGDVIRVYHQMYGWTASQGFPNGKLFRVTQVQESKDDDGNLGARLTLTEYNDQVYDNFLIDKYQPAQNTGITDPTNISTPLAPIVSSQITTSSIPSFTLTATIPTTGSVLAMEFWYAVSSTPPTNTTQFKLYETQYYNSGAVFPNGSTVSITVTGLPSSLGQNYYFIVRAAGAQSKSLFSNNSAGLAWNPNPTATVTGQNFQAVYQPGTISVAMFANGQPDLANVVVSLYGLSGPGQVDYNSNIANLNNNEWSIDSPNIVYTDIAFPSAPTDAGTYAQWPAPSSMSGNVATISAPIVYKDSTGNLYTSPPASITLTKNLPGQEGGRGVVTLAYVPVNYNPTYGNSEATDSNLSSSFATTTGFSPPIDKDGAVFFNTTTGQSSSRRYNTTATPYKWESATLQVPGDVITNDSISTNQIRANSITAGKIAANAITANNITANSIVAGKIAANAITANNISANSITSDKIAANAITANSIAAFAITAGKIAANSITSNEISANSIDASKLQAFTITAGQIAAGTIDATRIAANTIRFENLVIGAVQQSKSTISDPFVQIQPFTNPSPAVWPVNTRTILPDGGVTIIPETDPTSSANTEYVEGSRIEVSFSVKMYTYPDVITSNPLVTADMYNLVELWKSGASSIYDRGFNSVKHSYNLSGSYVAPQIHAYGYGTGMDWYSTNGGLTWSQYEGNTTQKTVAAAIDTITTSGGYLSTNAVGPLQTDDIVINATSFSGYRVSQDPNNSLHKLVWTSESNGINYRAGNITYTDYKNSMLSLEASPHTGGDGTGYSLFAGSTLGQIMTGSDGDIFYANTWQPASGSPGSGGPTFYYRENVPGLLKTLYSNYSNQRGGANTYTAMICGQTGTILKSNRTYNSTGTWQSKPTYLSKSDGAGGYVKDTTKPLLTDLYGIAGNDALPGANGKWVAVGQYGIIMVSVNDGEDWVQIPGPVTTNLNHVRYCNGTWVAVGDSYKTAAGDTRCTIITTNNPLGTWTQIQETSFTESLNVIDYSYALDRINVGGQGIILTSSGSSIAFSAPPETNFGPTETYDLTRLTYYGSWPRVSDTFLPTPEQRILNGQVFSATIVDSAYVAGQETTYYLVIGNMAQRPVYAGQVFLQVTEVKR